MAIAGCSEPAVPPDPEDPRQMLGRRVQALRTARQWRQEDLALATGLHRTYIGSVERGERNVSLDNLVRIARALDITVAELLQGV